MTDEVEDLEVEVEQEEEDYDIAIHDGTLFIMNASTFFDAHNIIAIHNIPDGVPYALIAGRGWVDLADLVGPVKSGKLTPVK